MFVWHHHSLLITQYFSHYLWTPYLSPVHFLFFIFFSIPKLESSEKKKKYRTSNPGKEKKNRTAKLKKKKKNTEQPTQEKKKKKEKNNRIANQKKKKIKSKGGQKSRLCVPYVCSITILPLSYEL